MSIRIMQKVWETPCQSHTEKLILLALADNANDEGYCWPSIRTIAKKCSASTSTIQGHIKALRQKGWLSVASGNYQKSNRYVLNIGGVSATATPCIGCRHITVIEPSSPNSSLKESKGFAPKVIPVKWKPNDETKDEQLARLPNSSNYPSQAEFDDYIENNCILIEHYRPDLYSTLCEQKWREWKPRFHKWVKIGNWRRYVDALEKMIEENP